MKKIFKYMLGLAMVALTAGFTACDNNDEIFDPEWETYTLSGSFNSLAGDIQVLLDGEPINGLGGVTSGKVITMRSTKLLVSKGERKLEMRDAGSGTVLWDSTLVVAAGQNCNISKYWNGEKITSKLEMPTPAEGNVGILFSIEAGETLVEPMDLECMVEVRNPVDNSYSIQTIDIIGDDDDLINNYVPGSGQMVYLEMSSEVAKSFGNLFRAYKAGTKEPYHTLVTLNTIAGARNAGRPSIPVWYTNLDECLFQPLSLDLMNNKANTILYTIKEIPGTYGLNGETLLDPVYNREYVVNHVALGKTGEVRYTADIVYGSAQ